MNQQYLIKAAGVVCTGYGLMALAAPRQAQESAGFSSSPDSRLQMRFLGCHTAALGVLALGADDVNRKRMVPVLAATDVVNGLAALAGARDGVARRAVLTVALVQSGFAAMWLYASRLS
jgi:hypothetical protein